MKLSEISTTYRIGIGVGILVIIAAIVSFQILKPKAPGIAEPGGGDTTKQSPTPVILTPEMAKALIEEMSATTTVSRLSEKKVEALKEAMSATKQATPVMPADELTKLLDSMSAQ